MTDEQFTSLKKLIGEQFRRLEAALLICLGGLITILGMLALGDRDLVAIGLGIVLIVLGIRSRSF